MPLYAALPQRTKQHFNQNFAEKLEKEPISAYKYTTISKGGELHKIDRKMELLAGISCLWEKIANSIAEQADNEFAQIMCEAIREELAGTCPELLTEKDEKGETEGAGIAVVYKEEETQAGQSFNALASLEGIMNSYELGRRKSKTD